MKQHGGLTSSFIRQFVQEHVWILKNTVGTCVTPTVEMSDTTSPRTSTWRFQLRQTSNGRLKTATLPEQCFILHSCTKQAPHQESLLAVDAVETVPAQKSRSWQDRGLRIPRFLVLVSRSGSSSVFGLEYTTEYRRPYP